ncbi:hypothetical protein FBZ89_14215 [Nitrospirillum amazonense]|uniref:Uncharacterized protein n=1 Tax=Nitrospirillum amazonense TaxID=28077 RepID=A0A560EIX0_9PROT|nr:hypothetical protein [Nitrospirillum amazonense]TWB09331.1 hypothetical protein FBZ89_14215 [Nitrospirillum amazonense]
MSSTPAELAATLRLAYSAYDVSRDAHTNRPNYPAEHFGLYRAYVDAAAALDEAMLATSRDMAAAQLVIDAGGCLAKDILDYLPASHPHVIVRDLIRAHDAKEAAGQAATYAAWATSFEHFPGTFEEFQEAQCDDRSSAEEAYHAALSVAAGIPAVVAIITAEGGQVASDLRETARQTIRGRYQAARHQVARKNPWPGPAGASEGPQRRPHSRILSPPRYRWQPKG